jgi:hypothetical protein
LSGINQHHVWQHLQRGFGNRKKKQVQVFVYTIDKEPFLTSTRNFGAERHFYSQNGDHTADENITDFEDSATDIVNQLRNGPAGPIFEVERVASLLSHIEVRTKFLRDELSFHAGQFARATRSIVRDKRTFKRFLLQALKDNPDLISDEIKKAGIPADLQSTAENYAETFLKNNFDAFASNLQSDVLPAMEGLESAMSKIGRETHLKLLRQDASPEKRRDLYSGLKYEVIEVADPGLILPDTMVTFVADGGFAPFCPLGSPLAKCFSQYHLPDSSMHTKNIGSIERQRL